MKKIAIIDSNNVKELKRLLHERGITQDQIAKEADVSRRAVAYFLSGHTKSLPIYHASIRLLGKVLHNDLKKVKESTERFVKIL